MSISWLLFSSSKTRFSIEFDGDVGEFAIEVRSFCWKTIGRELFHSSGDIMSQNMVLE